MTISGGHQPQINKCYLIKYCDSKLDDYHPIKMCEFMHVCRVGYMLNQVFLFDAWMHIKLSGSMYKISTS